MFFTSKTLQPLSLDQIHRKAPAVFAQQPAERVSDKYLFVSTEKLLSGLLNNGWSCVSAVQQGSRTDTAAQTNKHALMFARNDMLGREFGNQGDTMPLLKFENAHNGLSSFMLQAGIFRKACANGLTVPDSMIHAPRIRHTTSIDRETVEASFQIVNEFPKLIEAIEVMKSIELSNDERMILSQSAARLLFDQNQINETNQALTRSVHEQLLTPRRYDDKKTNLWTSINVIQENAIRGNVKLFNAENRSMRKTRAVKNIQRDSKINQELMTLAAEMAKIKGQKIVA